MRSLFLVYGAVFAIACNDQAKKQETEMVLTTEANDASFDSTEKTPAKDSVPRNIQVDSIIHLAFMKDSNAVTVKGHLDKKGDPVICYLPVVNGKKLTAVVTPEKQKANIRFSHIYLPNGKSDGPFSPSMKYNLIGEGLYKLYIAPNRMAGDPMSTDFTLTVKVQ
jgi:hypothetical protein